MRDVLARPGQPLERGVRERFGAGLDHDFSTVRVHADGQASRSADALSARAYTVGQHIAFGANNYRPDSQDGARLIAHELIHVIQQGSADASGKDLVVGDPRGPCEVEAERAAATLTDAPGTRVAVRECAPTRVIQRQPRGAPQAPPAPLCPAAGQRIDFRPGTCNPREPGDCVLYEDWISTFANLRTFRAADRAGSAAVNRFDVLGEAPATATESPPVPLNRRFLDRFVDHPTQRWVDACLPANLRRTAYELPSDCADITVILRHVWLAAHRRTEMLRGFQVGSRTGRAEVESTRSAIVGIDSQGTPSILRPYVDDAGRPLRSFAALAPRLHPGDVLVWEHHAGSVTGARSGGHVHTITGIIRVHGVVTSIHVLQGNEPLPSSRADYVREVRGQAKAAGEQEPSTYDIHHAPGRRIETDALTASELEDVVVTRRQARGQPQSEPIWRWAGNTTLLAAGPPSGVRRPAVPAARPGAPAPARLLGWVAPIEGASLGSLPVVMEGVLSDMRSDVEGGVAVAPASVQRIGEAAGRRLWRLARGAAGFGHREHFQPLRRIVQLIEAYGGIGRSVPRNNPNTPLVVTRFTALRDTFERSARGLDDTTFAPVTGRNPPLRILVTGFDPFVFGGTPGPGVWNPSGAAALALDGTTFGDGRLRVAVQSAVLPVDFDRFRTGIVERLVRDTGAVDGVVTVSLDASIANREQVRLEQFVIGTHGLERGPHEAIPAAPGSGTGPALLEATDATTIAPRMGAIGPRHAPSPRALVGTATQLLFTSAAEADAALVALGDTPQGRVNPTITDVVVLRRLAPATLVNQPGGRIRFTAGTPARTFAPVLVEGPGGSFLSNEVSYRVLRERRTGAGSFHVHVPGGPDVAAGARVPQATTAVRTAVIANVRRAVLELARLAASRRP